MITRNVIPNAKNGKTNGKNKKFVNEKIINIKILDMRTISFIKNRQEIIKKLKNKIQKILSISAVNL